MSGDFSGDLVQRTPDLPSYDDGGLRAERRKARLADAITRLKADPVERARIAAIAGLAGVESGTDETPAPPERDTQPPAWLDELDIAGDADQAWQRVNHELRRTSEERRAAAQRGDYLAWLGGGDREILEEVPQERAGFVQMAGVLLTTAGIASISMFFALHNGVGEPVAASVALCLFWGFVIIN